MINIITSLLPSLFKLGDKLIVDKDKKMEYAFKVQEMTFKMLESIVQMKTVPWVDAVVKLLFALMALARPIGTFYLSLKGIDIALDNKEIDMMSGGLMGMFPTWMAAREVDKKRKHEKALIKNEYSDYEKELYM